MRNIFLAFVFLSFPSFFFYIGTARFYKLHSFSFVFCILSWKRVFLVFLIFNLLSVQKDNFCTKNSLAKYWPLSWWIFGYLINSCMSNAQVLLPRLPHLQSMAILIFYIYTMLFYTVSHKETGVFRCSIKGTGSNGFKATPRCHLPKQEVGKFYITHTYI